METSETTLQKPSCGQVFGAYFIDALLIWVLGALSIGLGIVLARMNRNLLPDIGWIILWDSLGPVSALVYYALTEGRKGGSVGKRKFWLQTVFSKTGAAASCGRILMAYVIDFLLLSVIAFPLYFGISVAALLITEKIGAVLVFLDAVGGGYLLCLVPLAVFYFTVLEGFFGRGVGKLICGLRVYQKLK